MKTILYNEYFWVFIAITTSLTTLFIYWFLRDQSNRVDNINRRCKMLAAIFFEMRSLNYPVLPRRKSLLEAGINVDDLLYFGYTTAEIQVIFPEYQPHK